MKNFFAYNSILKVNCVVNVNKPQDLIERLKQTVQHRHQHQLWKMKEIYMLEFLQFLVCFIYLIFNNSV